MRLVRGPEPAPANPQPGWSSGRGAGRPASEDADLVAGVLAGDEQAFVRLVERHDGSLRRIARLYVPDAAVDDVVQDCWIAVLHGLGRFEGRSSTRTWIVRILVNTAIRNAERSRRQIPFAAFADPIDAAEPSVAPERFQGPEGAFPGGWVSFPERWDEQPEARYLSTEGVEAAMRAIAALPPAQREVVCLRDVEGWSSVEVSEVLRISPGNQRVLLHRGRSRIRFALERGMTDAHAPVSKAPGRRVAPGAHPDLESYYDRTTDRDRVDAHVATCDECQQWLAAIHDRLRRFTCTQFVELVTEFLEDAVDEPLGSTIDDHLRLCEGCRNYLDEMRATVAAIGRTAREDPAREPSDQVRAGVVAAFRLWRGDPGQSARRPG